MKTKQKNKTFIIFVDMDGVVANWEGRVQDILGDQYATASKSYKWAMITKYNNDVQPFYATLDKMLDADELWTFVTETFQYYSILSAAGSTPKDSSTQKRLWLLNNLGETNTIIVRDGGDKAKFANPKTILIDDRDKVLNPFIAAGGIGILHTSAKDTIKQLEKIIS